MVTPTTKNLFVSFTTVDKLGINPQSHYDTPLGIYSYPAEFIVDNIGDYTSMKDWKKGEKLMFMNWLQMFAAQRGTILESKGEYLDAVKKQNA